jgi:hypothetical protein
LLTPIIVVPMNNGKLKICTNFRILNATTKKVSYPLPFINEILNIITRYEANSFLDGFYCFKRRETTRSKENTSNSKHVAT